MARFHDCAPIILDGTDIDDWMLGDSPASLLRPARKDALREWVVSSRVNRSGVGDDDPRRSSSRHRRRAVAPPIRGMGPSVAIREWGFEGFEGFMKV